MSLEVGAQERQVTFSAKNHNLDNNDNFSPDQKFLCYDTREMVGPGLDNCQSIEKVEIATGTETVLYAPTKTLTGEKCAPGLGAASYHPELDKVAFIHGPPLDQVESRGYYGKPNRNGAEVAGDGSQKLTWIDFRDVDTSRPTLPGAHRGGTHRHEYTLDGRRIGYTYDDFLRPEYARTIGYMEPHKDAPGGASHYFCVLIKPAKTGESKPGEIESAYGDSWIGKKGLMRAFIGKVRAADGVGYEESLFVVDVPATVDITTAKAGSANEYPTPPKGLTVRRLTHTLAVGVVRGTVQGDRIAYYADDANGKKQIFIIASDGSDKDPDPKKRPIQLTHFEDGAGPGVRWHPSGDALAVTTNGAIAVICTKPGDDFGKSKLLTGEDTVSPRLELVWSPDGTQFAYVRAVPTKDADGKPYQTYAKKDPQQIFVLPYAGNDF